MNEMWQQRYSMLQKISISKVTISTKILRAQWFSKWIIRNVSREEKLPFTKVMMLKIQLYIQTNFNNISQ